MRKIKLLFVCTCLLIMGCSGPHWIDIAQSYPVNSTKVYINDLGRNLTPEEKNLYPTFAIFSIFPHSNKYIMPSDIKFTVSPNANIAVGENGGFITVTPKEQGEYHVKVSCSIKNVEGDSCYFSVLKLSKFID